MPPQYEAIRDRFEAQGVPVQDAKSHAAAIYNSKHPKAPVTGRTPEPKVPPRPDAHEMSAARQHLREQMRRQSLVEQMGAK